LKLQLDKILISRENRFAKMQKLKAAYNAVITVKSNIPGDNKKLNIAYFLVKRYFKLIPKELYDFFEFYDDFGGPYYLLGSNNNPKHIKKELILIEENTKLGRFIDLDVYDGLKILSRGFMRKCYICDNPAFVCNRENNHSLDELLDFVKNKIKMVLVKETKNLIDKSILTELNLHPKFGLVTPYTNGSHSDMNYSLMINAKDAILPYLVKMFEVGFCEIKIDSIFYKIRQIGLEAEEAMLNKTNNINAYKGLIFNMGLMVAAYGHVLYYNGSLDNIFDEVKEISKPVIKDFNTDINSFGLKAFKDFNIKGIRGEALNGFGSVKKALPYLKDLSDSSLIKTLIFIISEIEDTVLLKRAKTYEFYLEIKKIFKQHLISNEEAILSLNEFCLNNNLSFGGSADLLVLTVFIKLIENQFY